MGSFSLCLGCTVEQEQIWEARFCDLYSRDTGFVIALNLYSYLGYHNSTLAKTPQVPMLSLHHEKPIPLRPLSYVKIHLEKHDLIESK